MKQLSPVLVALTVFSCTTKNRENKPLIRDSLMTRYLKITDSLPWTDTIDPRRKLLAAYIENDTVYLRRSVEEVQGMLKYRDEMRHNLSCEQPKAINSYRFNEAYRFQYGASFCDQTVDITIGERNDSIILFGYHYKIVFNTDSCLSFEKLEKTLSTQQWDIIKSGVLRADFWGLKPDNARLGMDGSSLTVTGYQKPVNAFEGRYSRVSRWSAEEMALGELFKKVLDISGVKAPCFHY